MSADPCPEASEGPDLLVPDLLPEVDVMFLAYPARRRFADAVATYAEAIRIGSVLGMNDGHQRMQDALEVHLRETRRAQQAADAPA